MKEFIITNRNEIKKNVDVNVFERLLIVDANLKKAAALISTEECDTETDGIVRD